MKTRSKIGLSILAGGLSFVGAANAVDLILNGSFEAITGGTPNSYNSITDGTLAGWDGVISGISYGYNYFSGPVIPASENPGLVYSWNQDGEFPHTAYTNALTQTVDLTNGVSAANIDAGSGQYTFSAWMSSYTLQDDQPYLTVRFFDASTNQVGGMAIFDRVHSLFFTSFAADFPAPSVFNQTANFHDWAKYVKTAGIPRLARTAVVGIQHSPNGTLSGRPDSYVDVVKLDVTVANTRPSLESATPLDSGAPGVSYISGKTSISLTLRDGFYAVNPGTVAFSFDGVNQPAATVTKVGTLTTIHYTPGVLASGSSHSYQVVYSDNGPGLPQTNLLSFTVVNYETLPASYALPRGSGEVRGFTFRTVSASSQVVTPPSQRNTIARAEEQLNGTLINPDTTLAYTNDAVLGPNPDGSYSIDTVLNFQDDGLDEGDFPNDAQFPGLPFFPNNYFSTEALLALDLPAGYYQFGVNSDDGFQVTATAPQGVSGSPIVLGLFNAGRGASDTLFDVLVPTDGIYPFRIVYFETTGSAEEEFFSVTNLVTGGKVLVNDTNYSNAISSYRVLAPIIISIVKSGSNVVLNWTYGNPPFQVQFKNNLAGSWSNLGPTTTSRTATVPIQPGAGFFRILSSP
jgi:hypothetical protein